MFAISRNVWHNERRRIFRSPEISFDDAGGESQVGQLNLRAARLLGGLLVSDQL